VPLLAQQVFEPFSALQELDMPVGEAHVDAFVPGIERFVDKDSSGGVAKLACRHRRPPVDPADSGVRQSRIHQRFSSDSVGLERVEIFGPLAVVVGGYLIQAMRIFRRTVIERVRRVISLARSAADT